MPKKVDISDSVINSMINDHKNGTTLDILANKHGVSRTSISRKLRAKGYSPIKNKEIPLKDNNYIDLYFKNELMEVIAKKYLISASTLIRRLKNVGAIKVKRKIRSCFNYTYDEILDYIDVNKIINIVKTTKKQTAERDYKINRIIDNIDELIAS